MKCKMIKLYVLLLICFLIESTFACMDNNDNLTKNHFALQKPKASFYVGQLPDKDLRVTMERINSRNRHLFGHYIWQQIINEQAIRAADEVLINHKDQQMSVTHGSYYAWQVLIADYLWDNLQTEVYIARITTELVPRPIPNDIITYKREGSRQSHSFADSTLMFVTVTSETDAKITTHMGIARSLESLESKTLHKNLSLYLHSFAAQVMLNLNPARIGMINAPVFHMEKILAEALDTSALSVGTLEMLELMQNFNNHEYFEKFKAEHYLRMKEQVNSDIPLILNALQDKFRSSIALADLYQEDDDRDFLEGKYNDFIRCDGIKECLHSDTAGHHTLTDKGKELYIEHQISREFLIHKLNFMNFPGAILNKSHHFDKNNFFSFNEAIMNLSNKNENKLVHFKSEISGFIQFMEMFPPVISVDGVNKPIKHMTIYDQANSSKILIKMSKGDNRAYQWLFNKPFEPVGCQTHLVYIDLKALANLKKIVPLK